MLAFHVPSGKTCEMCDQKLKMLKGGQNCKGCGKVRLASCSVLVSVRLSHSCYDASFVLVRTYATAVV